MSRVKERSPNIEKKNKSRCRNACIERMVRWAENPNTLFPAIGSWHSYITGTVLLASTASDRTILPCGPVLSHHCEKDCNPPQNCHTVHTVHTVHVTVLILAVRADTITRFILFGVTACLAAAPGDKHFTELKPRSVKCPAAHLRLTTVLGCLYDGPGSTAFPRTVRSTFAPILQQHYARAVLKGSILRWGIWFGSCRVMSFAI